MDNAQKPDGEKSPDATLASKEPESRKSQECICVFCDARIAEELCPECGSRQEVVWQDGIPLRDDFHRYGASPYNDPKDFGLEIVAEQISDYPTPGDHSYEVVAVWQNPETGELRAALDYGHSAPDLFAALTWNKMKSIHEAEDLRTLVDRNFPDGLFDNEALKDFRNKVSQTLSLEQLEIRSSRLSSKKVRLDPEREGYWHEGVFREGFLDDPSLPSGDRRLVAGWARSLTPNTLQESQRELLKPLPQSEPVSKAQQEAGALHHLLWGSKAKRPIIKKPL